MLNNNQNFALICPYPTCRHIHTRSQPEFHTYSTLSHQQIYFAETHSEFGTYSPLSHLQTYSHWITIRIWQPLSHQRTYLHWITTRIWHLFTLIPPADIFHAQTQPEFHSLFTLIPPKQIYLRWLHHNQNLALLFNLIPPADIFAPITTRISHLFNLIPPADIFALKHNQNLALIRPYPSCRYICAETQPECGTYPACRHIHAGITIQNFTLIRPYPTSRYILLKHIQNLALIHPYPTSRHIHTGSQPQFGTYSPLSHLQTYSHWIMIRISHLFALVPSGDIFALDHNQNLALICPYLICRHICTQTQPEFGTYLPLSHLQTYSHWITTRITHNTLVWIKFPINVSHCDGVLQSIVQMSMWVSRSNWVWLVFSYRRCCSSLASQPPETLASSVLPVQGPGLQRRLSRF